MRKSSRQVGPVFNAFALTLGFLKITSSSARSRSALSRPFLGEASPTKIDHREKKYPYSNLSTGGPSSVNCGCWPKSRSGRRWVWLAGSFPQEAILDNTSLCSCPVSFEGCFCASQWIPATLGYFPFGFYIGWHLPLVA